MAQVEVDHAMLAQRAEPGPQLQVAFLGNALRDAYTSLRRQVEDLTGEEFFWEPALPGAVGGALAYLEEGQQRLLSALVDLGDADLPTPRATNWGQQWPTWRILWTMVTHDLEHGAEIGLLRQLYRHSGERGG